MRAAVAYLSPDNLLHNLRTIKNAARFSKFIAMIKANAYGHGLRSVALRLQPYTDFFGVASIDEAIQLRKVNITIPIILMEGIFDPEELSLALKENLQIVVHSPEQLKWLLEYSENKLIDRSIHLWIKIDTGMGRLGFNLTEGLEAYKIVRSLVKVNLPIGIMSHFACAEQAEHSLNYQQIYAFEQFIQKLQLKDGEIIKSLCNSAGIFNFPKYHYEVVRSGLALYGGSPLKSTSAAGLNLQPVMTLTTRIIALKQLGVNSTIGYGAKFKCKTDLLIGVVAIGYGDGYPCSASALPVLVKGKRCRIVGQVSMDLATVDLTNCPDAKVGDQVILWGKGLPIEEIARVTGYSVYNLLTGVQNRVKFIWQNF